MYVMEDKVSLMLDINTSINSAFVEAIEPMVFVYVYTHIISV
mgnify:CR=1 FL=1